MTALSYKTAPFCVLRIQLRLCRDKLMKQTKFHWLQLADCKNSPNRGIRRGRPLTSQTAFGGQLPYKGSLVQPAVRFHHSPSEYHGRLLRATSICHGTGYSHKPRRYALWASPTESHTGDKILCGCMPHL